MLTTAIVLRASLLVPDAAGHLNYKPIPNDGAAAIVSKCSGTTMPEHCASLLLVLGFRESGFNMSASHDGGKGCGAFGALCSFPHSTWAEQVDVAWRLVIKSAEACQEPLALYCSGSCTRGLKVAREYMRLAQDVCSILKRM